MRLRGASSRGRCSRNYRSRRTGGSVPFITRRSRAPGAKSEECRQIASAGRTPDARETSRPDSFTGPVHKDAALAGPYGYRRTRRVGLTLNGDSTRARFLNPQQRHNVLSQEERRIRSHMTAEVAGGRHRLAPANLTQLGVAGVVVSSESSTGGTRKPTKPAPTVFDPVHRAEQTCSRPQDQQVQWRPENDHLPATARSAAARS